VERNSKRKDSIMKCIRKLGAIAVAGLFVLIILGGPCSSAEAQEEAEKPVAFRLAVVDMDRVMDKCEQWADYLEQRNGLQDKMRRALQQYDRQARMLRSEYENLPPGSDAAREKGLALEEALRLYDETQRDFEQELRREHMQALGDLFNKVSAAIREYAEQNEIDLVLKKQELDVSAAQPVEMGMVITTAQVLYVQERYDITPTIVEALNARYPGDIKEK
jgi:Skp family chaperone for outer membrane proteins